jgi:hypothetical protein
MPPVTMSPLRRSALLRRINLAKSPLFDHFHNADTLDGDAGKMTLPCFLRNL